MDNTILYYKTLKGKSFIVVNKRNIIDRVQLAERNKEFVEWEKDSVYQIELLKNC